MDEMYCSRRGTGQSLTRASKLDQDNWIKTRQFQIKTEQNYIIPCNVQSMKMLPKESSGLISRYLLLTIYLSNVLFA